VLDRLIVIFCRECVRVVDPPGGQVGVAEVDGDLQVSPRHDLLAKSLFTFERPAGCGDCLFAAAGVK
jgi:hypothetical protein